ncbi:hypothetical protein [Micromonospora sp. DH14]|uniref:nSTAND1 domain-containing NTPase n=1 Tax=Micromonospora sp. DH14 TaxID=3040120 RepID=UPI002442404C|nr:hypothetical protein [Micromonospora sp. DH14]MDG9674655.1 hypothetical protein [Micromonospora sp. DH14]
MGRPDRPLDPEAGELERFALDLRKLRAKAGTPTYRQLARRAHFSVTTLAKAASGETVPILQVTLAYVAACDGDLAEWTERWHSLIASVASADTTEVSRGPYWGMAAFQPEDSEWFFGRERMVAQLCEMLTRLRFVAVFAPSGAGKSSLLRAGLLATVAENPGKGQPAWATVLMTPGEHPIEELATQLVNGPDARDTVQSRLTDDPANIRATIEHILDSRPSVAHLLIVVDQFEELFTLCRDEEERSGFIAALLAAADLPRARVVLGVRADFYGRCAAYPALVAALHEHQLLVGPMDDEDLRRTITGPAERAGLQVDPALVEMAVADVDGQTGALPLLSHALLETSRLRQGRRITLAHYRESGGVNGAITRTAEGVYAQFDEGQRGLARDIFLRLTALGDGTEDTRRRAPSPSWWAAPTRWPRPGCWTGRGVSGPGLALPGGPDGQLWSPVFNPDGKRLVTAGSDGTVRIWQVDATGGPIVLRGHEGPVWGVAFSPDGRLVASAGEDTTVRVWDARGGARPVVLRGHTKVAVGVAFSPDGRQLASSGHDATVRLWDLAERTATTTLTGPRTATRTLVFSRDGSRLACSSSDGTAWLWSLTGSAAPVVLRGHEGTVEGLALSPDEQWIATTSDDLTVRIWNADGAGDPLVLRGHTNRVWAVAFSPDGSRLVSAADDGTLRVWDPGSERVILRGHDKATWSAAFTPDGQRVVSGGEDGTVRVWNLAAPDEPRLLGRHDGDVYGLTVSPDGSRVATGGSDGTVRVWDLAGRDDPVVLRGHEKQAWTADFSPDGRLLASVSNDRSLRIWDLTGQRGPVVHRVAEEIRYAAFSPDGTKVATAGAEGTLRIWDALGAADPLLLPGHEGLVWAVAFSPDGERVASAGFDGTVQIHSITGGDAPMVLRGHEGPVWHVSFSPDGRWVLSSGKDGTARLWRASEAAQSVTFDGFGASVETVDFSPDGERLVSTHDDGTVRVWPCRACAPVQRLLEP